MLIRNCFFWVCMTCTGVLILVTLRALFNIGDIGATGMWLLIGWIGLNAGQWLLFIVDNVRLVSLLSGAPKDYE
jgi:hypothetical protein